MNRFKGVETDVRVDPRDGADADTLGRVRVALEDYFAQEDDTVRSQEVWRVIPRRFSRVMFLRVQTGKGTRRMVVKTTDRRHEREAFIDDRNQSTVEFEILRTLHEGFRQMEGCSVPRPIVVIPEIETYVTEFVEGRLLEDGLKSTRYLSSRGRFRSLCHHFLLCGRWLRKFHALTGVRDTGPDCLGETLRRCEERLLLIERTRDPRIPRRFSDDVMSFLNQQIAELHGERVAVTGRHGDFGPWNIIAGPEGVTVLDFMGYHEGPLPVDLLKMLIDVGYNEKHPLTQGRRADSLRARFLDGYGDLPAVQRPVLVVCETLHRLSGLLGCLRSEGDPLLRRVQKDRWLRDCLRWFTEEGSKVPTWPT